MTVYAIMAMAAFADPPLDAESRKNLELVAAACNAARSAHRGFTARMEYTVEASPHVQHYTRPEHVRGSVSWDGTRVRYCWEEAGPPGGFAVCVVRDPKQFFRAERFDSRVLANYVTFEIRPPLGSVSAIFIDRLSIGDPAMWFAGTTLTLVQEGLARESFGSPSLRNEGGMVVFRGTLGKDGPIRSIHFDPNTGYLPVEREQVYQQESTRLVSTDTYQWDRFDGKWAMKRWDGIERWIDAPTKKAAEAHRVLAFSDIKVDAVFGEKEFTADALPLPVGSGGIDKRVLPTIGLIRDTGGIVQQGKQSAAAREAQTTAPRTDAAADPEAAAAARRAYYWRLAAKICGGLAAAALLGAVAWKLRSRT